MPKTNKTKYALLGVLTVQPASGYDIKKFCDSSISHFWTENYTHIYSVLKDMEKEGLVVRKTSQSDRRPQKSIYSITENGRKSLNDWLLSPIENAPHRNELLLKLFFSSTVPKKSLISMIKTQKKRHENSLEEYRQIEHSLMLDKELKSHPDLQLWLASINYGKLHSEATIKWCQDTLNCLNDLRNQDES